MWSVKSSDIIDRQWSFQVMRFSRTTTIGHRRRRQEAWLGVKMSEVIMSEVKMTEVIMSEVKMSEVKMSEVKISEVIISEVKMSEVKISEVKCQR